MAKQNSLKNEADEYLRNHHIVELFEVNLAYNHLIYNRISVLVCHSISQKM